MKKLLNLEGPFRMKSQFSLDFKGLNSKVFSKSHAENFFEFRIHIREFSRWLINKSPMNNNYIITH